jgi:hypothetical protein
VSDPLNEGINESIDRMHLGNDVDSKPGTVRGIGGASTGNS